MKLSKVFLLLGTILPVALSAQYSSPYWTRAEKSAWDLSSTDEPMLNINKGDFFEFDFDRFKESSQHMRENLVFEIPTVDGKLKEFKLKENTTLHPDLSSRFPDIRCYNIVSQDSPSIWGKLTLTSKGVRAMIFEPGKPTTYIDNYFYGDPARYVVYSRDQLVPTNEFVCEVSGQTSEEISSRGGDGNSYNECELSTYRLAVACTGEYSTFHGGTVEDALEAIVISVDRVNAVYERDFAVTFTLIPNNDEIIFLDPDTDPYTNNSAFAMLGQNQQTINSIIGSANYDIGHVFSTSAGGVASFGSTCINSQKAQGVTGIAAPVGDPFDIDYVAHEIGHQFAGSHSFNNSCSGNRNNATAVEPGSGSSIMAYAGICPPNVQNNSDDHFHGVSMGEMGNEVTTDNCPVRTPLLNSAPIIEDIQNTIVIPAATPFVLTAQAIDLDGDILTYCWEQMDNDISNQPPEASSSDGPNFRSFSPTTNPTRYFPSLPDAENSTWEVLPDNTRDMEFRLTVRDNAVGGGCTRYEDVTVEVDDSAGPFVVEVPSSFGIVWESFTEQNVIWDVANTTENPINAETVDIFLSVNAGQTYPIQLANDVPNSGSYAVEVPSFNTTLARIMVMNSAGTFFDVSDNNFTIIGGVNQGFGLAVDDSGFACEGDDIDYQIQVVGAFDFVDPVVLSVVETPNGVDAVLSSTEVLPNQSTTLNVSNTQNAPIGSSIILIEGTSGEFSFELEVELNINELNPSPVELVSPANEAEGVGAISSFTWTESESPVITYDLELAFDETFTDLYEVYNDLPVNNFDVLNLPLETELFWRVRKDNQCGTSLSEVYSFSTTSCLLNMPNDLPLSISPVASTVESELEVFQVGTIDRIRVTNVEGLHDRVSDLTMTLVAPDGTESVLFSEICGSNDDFDLSFEDGATLDIDCPPTTGFFYSPVDPFSVFEGLPAEGIWKLRVADGANGVGGSLENWELEICYTENILSVDNLSDEEISLFPNPTNGIIQLEMVSPSTWNELNVLDIQGRILRSNRIGLNQNRISLDLSSLSPGVYLVNIKGDQNQLTYKVILTE
jgi:subtilisin-like proprotein convertase family protein